MSMSLLPLLLLLCFHRQKEQSIWKGVCSWNLQASASADFQIQPQNTNLKGTFMLKNIHANRMLQCTAFGKVSVVLKWVVLKEHKLNQIYHYLDCSLSVVDIIVHLSGVLLSIYYRLGTLFVWIRRGNAIIGSSVSYCAGGFCYFWINYQTCRNISALHGSFLPISSKTRSIYTVIPDRTRFCHYIE